MEISDLKRRLSERSMAVCEHLLPSGKAKSGEWTVGDLDGTPGKSLKVSVRGPKSGVWSDFATGHGGDLIDLWRECRGVSLIDALDEIREWLGVERPKFHGKETRQWKRPRRPDCHPPRARAKDYLTEDRCITGDVLLAYRIGETDAGEIVFPFLDPAGELVMAKRRKAGDGEKPVPTEAGCEKILFGWQAIDPNTREVVITEGEIDALSMAVYGFPALSVPYGGGGGAKQDWIESEFDRLDRFETIYLAMDADGPGQEAATEIASRLGHHRCRIVELPRKDANQCLTEGIPATEIAACIAAAKTMDPPGLRKAGDFTEAVIKLFSAREGAESGYTMPWAALRHRIRLRPGEVTVWSGASGDGKSQILSHCVVDWIDQGSRICLASLEMAPARSLWRMVKQAAGVSMPTEDYARAAMTWLDGGLWIFDHVGKMGLDGLLDVFEYARRRHGCDQFVIDSLMRLGVAGDDYTTQEQTMFRVVDWAIASGVHVHFVAHTRKGDAKMNQPPGTEDIKGAMEIGANAANIITVWRNRKLEAEMQKAEDKGDDAALSDLRDKPGVLLTVAKQRNGDWEGRAGLWFNQENYRYRSSGDDPRFGRDYGISVPANEAA